MATAETTPTKENALRGSSYQLTVNSYDRAATMIIALLILVGFTVLGLMIVFFADKFHSSVQPIPVVPVEATSANANQGLAMEPDPPGSEEASELEDPQLEDMLQVLTDSVTSSDVLLSDQDLEAEDIAGKREGFGGCPHGGAWG